MGISEVVQIAGVVVVSLGGGGGIVLGLSNWLGKVWADSLMQKERARHEQELEEFKTKSLLLLEREKALYQQQLEDFKAQLSRDTDRTALTLREKLSLYKEAIPPLVDFVTRYQTKPANLSPALMTTFETQRLATSALLGMFAPLPVFEAYNELIDYIFNCLEEKQSFQFPEFRDLAFMLMAEIRKDAGILGEELAYRGSR